MSETERAFGITTNPVEAEVDVTISAEACCVAQGEANATLTVTTESETTATEVEIDRARWEPGRFQVRATSTNEDALLSVFKVENDLHLMDLFHVGDGEYRNERIDDGRLSNPEFTEVRSNLGGSDTAEVEDRS